MDCFNWFTSSLSVLLFSRKIILLKSSASFQGMTLWYKIKTSVSPSFFFFFSTWNVNAARFSFKHEQQLGWIKSCPISTIQSRARSFNLHHFVETLFHVKSLFNLRPTCSSTHIPRFHVIKLLLIFNVSIYNLPVALSKISIAISEFLFIKLLPGELLVVVKHRP